MNFERYISESTLSRIFQHTNDIDDCFGIITAFKKELKPKVNMERNYELIAKIRNSKRFGYFFVKGSYIEKGEKVKEYSIFVVGGKNDNGNLKGFLKKWVKEYDQESALFKPVGDDKAYFLKGDGSMDLIGSFHPNRLSDYMTQLNHRKGTFVFEGVYSSMTMIERMYKDARERNEKNKIKERSML